jgi:hypothetical protein
MSERKGNYENNFHFFQVNTLLVKKGISPDVIEELREIILKRKKLTEEEMRVMCYIITILLQSVPLPLSEEEKKGYCYIGKDSSGLYKIGKTGNFKERQRVIKNMNPSFSMILVKYDTDYNFLEKILHANYFFYRVIGEWFCLTDFMVQKIKKEFGFSNVAHRIPLKEETAHE